jgi:hypothetical protein
MKKKKNGDAAKAVVRNLHDAIERVREDVAKIEFWADAVSGFSQPVPEYNPDEANIWLPAEQAKKLGHASSGSTGSAASKKMRGRAS